MQPSFPFHFIMPIFYGGLLDDPAFFLQIRPTGKSLLFDLGQAQHIAKRVLKSVEALFITHAHMDHFMGVDKFIRSVLVSPKTIQLFGPPGITDKFNNKLNSYDWNLTEKHYCHFIVSEIYDGHLKRFHFSGPEGFKMSYLNEKSLSHKLIYENKFACVSAVLCDHKIPVAVYHIEEKLPFRLSDEKLSRSGYKKGFWINDLKIQFIENKLGEKPLWLDRNSEGATFRVKITDTNELYQQLKANRPKLSVGYISDVAFNNDNRHKINLLMKNITFLISECTYLNENHSRALSTCHLSVRDVNELLKELKPSFFLPIHLSKTYTNKAFQLYEQLEMPMGCRLLYLPERRTPEPLLPNQVLMACKA
ncbi:MAG: MBL fold metallo-hydrolase [Deltaproteobacteria bacterium]|nr:MBL fold metallo-hydrolase [Deltaproteobacteria bacterium]